MSEDYLWDGSGEVDPELQHLEQTLGTLRYQPQQQPTALNLPPNVVQRQQEPPIRRAFSYPVFAIAASLILMLMTGLVYWLIVPAKTNETLVRIQPPVIETKDTSSVVDVSHPSSQYQTQKTESVESTNRPTPQVRQPVIHVARGAHAAPPQRRTVVRETYSLASLERARGEEAKTKLMLALRIASLELRDVRRRVYAENTSLSLQEK